MSSSKSNKFQNNNLKYFMNITYVVQFSIEKINPGSYNKIQNINL